MRALCVMRLCVMRLCGVRLYVLGVGCVCIEWATWSVLGAGGRGAVAKTSLTSTDQHCWSSKATLQPAISRQVPQKFKIM